MALPPTVDLEMIRRDSLTLAVSVTDPDGAAFDLTSYPSITWIVAKNVNAAAAITKTVGDGITVVNASEGSITIELLPADTATLSGSYYHELQVTQVDPDDGTHTVMRGALSIEKDNIE